jgi:hypothetical protein
LAVHFPHSSQKITPEKSLPLSLHLKDMYGALPDCEDTGMTFEFAKVFKMTSKRPEWSKTMSPLIP